MALKRVHKVGIFLLILTLLLIGYSYLFRTYLDGEQYLQIAYDYTGQDPKIINWREPEFEVISHEGRLAVHIIFHTSEDMARGPISLYIDPFEKAVFDEEPRGRPATTETSR